VACLIQPDSQGRRSKEVRTFATTTAELLSFRDWLVTEGCTHVAMEATGVFWKCIWNVLEGETELLLCPRDAQ